MAKGKYEEWLTPEALIVVQGWARDGLTDIQIAQNIGISKQTFYDWKNRYPDFADSVKKGKEVIDRQVENALLKSAMGFEYEEETVTNKGEVVKVKRFERPSNTAQIFWLKNRKPAEWRDKQELKIDKTEETDQEQAINQLKELRKKMTDEPEKE